MNTSGFHHLAIQVRDLEGAAAFYREVLGLSELARHRREDGTLRSVWLSVDQAGGFLALEEAAGGQVEEAFRHPRLGLLLVALRIAAADRRAIEAELARRGVKVVHQSRWTLYLRDPEGNRIALSHHPHDPPE